MPHADSGRSGHRCGSAVGSEAHRLAQGRSVCASTTLETMVARPVTTNRRIAAVVRWILLVQAVVWAGVAVALGVTPGRWTGSPVTSVALAVVLGCAALAFAVAAVGVGRRPPRLVWLALVLAVGAAATSLTDQVGVADLAAFGVNLALAAMCVLLLVRRSRTSIGAHQR
jgi:hypothetical protein